MQQSTVDITNTSSHYSKPYIPVNNMSLRLKSFSRLQRLQFSSFHGISNFQKKKLFSSSMTKEMKSMKSHSIYPSDNISQIHPKQLITFLYIALKWLLACTILHWGFEKRVSVSSIFLLYCQYRWERTYMNSFISHSEKKTNKFPFYHTKSSMVNNKPSCSNEFIPFCTHSTSSYSKLNLPQLTVMKYFPLFWLLV